MTAILLGVLAGIALGMLYLVSAKQQVRRTLISSILLGVFVGVLVELARRPLFTAIFTGVSTIFLAEFIRWVLGSVRRKNQLKP